MILKGLINDWKIVEKVSRLKDISDHRPVWIKTCNLKWGSKPFKVFNTWFEQKDFMEFIKVEVRVKSWERNHMW